jgi:hypothetical protein
MKLQDITAKLKGESVDVLSININEKKLVVREGIVSQVSEQYIFLQNFGIKFCGSEEGILEIRVGDSPIYKNYSVSDAYSFGKSKLSEIEQEEVRINGKYLL